MTSFHPRGPERGLRCQTGPSPLLRRWWPLALFVVLVLGIPACLRWGDMVKFPFDETPSRTLEASQPQCVLIGDSMLGSRIDIVRLNQLAEFRCDSLAFPGASSAVWYLIMENIVGALAHPPQTAVIFFRDRQLTLPAQRTEGRYRNGLEAFMREPEPQFDEILDVAQGAHARVLQHLLLSAYPAEKHRAEWQEGFQEKIFKLTVGGRKKTSVRQRLAGMFDLKNLRHVDHRSDSGENEEKARMNGDNQDFADALGSSFLPLILKVADAHQIQMIFFRVKCRPRHQLVVEPDRPGLRQYIQDLDAYLQDHRAVLVDESQATDITEDFYGEGDHVADDMMRPYTELFWKRMGPILTDRSRLSAQSRR